MSKKNSITTADYIPFDDATRTAHQLLHTKHKNIGLYIIIAINTGLRVSDILTLDITSLRHNDKITLIEKKTQKKRTIKINNNIKEVLSQFIFDDPFNVTIQTLNRKLKEVFYLHSHLNISTHSLRKTFGRRIYDNNEQSDNSLVLLSEIFNHSSTSITRKYLGLRQIEIDNIYDNL